MKRLGRRLASLLIALGGAVSACSTSRIPPMQPVSAPPAAVVPAPDSFPLPPAASDAPTSSFPPVSRTTLKNGLAVSVVERHTLPLIARRLVIHSGQASDGASAGRAKLAAELLKADGTDAWSPLELTKRAEALGSSLEIETGPDATVLTMSVASPQLEAAVDLLSKVILRPRFDASEFDKLKQREIENTTAQLLSDPQWEASMVLYQHLFRTHPYAHFDALPSELAAISLADCRTWHRTQLAPSKTELVLVGDLDSARGEASAKRSFSGWRGAALAEPLAAAVQPQSQRTVWLIDRPGFSQSEMVVAGLGPPRSSPSWPAVAAANQVLGGDSSGRLFQDVREKRSLAYRTGSRLVELRSGRAPLVLSAGTRAAKTAETLRALLQQAATLVEKPPEESEVATATRYLTDSFLFLTERVEDLATLVSRLRVLGLPDDYYDSYREGLRHLDAGGVFAATLQTVDLWSPLVVVVADATQVEQSLRAFGPVAVLNPREEFAMSRELSKL